MPLGVNQNLAASGVIIQLKNNEKVYQRQIERLSSGLRINRAADDPAGLVISDLYMNQVDGLDQAVKNANDAVNVVQTAEGALDEIAQQLRGMRTLALHAANTGPNDGSAVAADQNQIASAISTINRIASTTQFGTRKLLDGSSGVSGAPSDSNVTFLGGTAATVAGTYDVHIATAATRGSVTSAAALATAKVPATNVPGPPFPAGSDAQLVIKGDAIDGDGDGTQGAGVTLDFSSAAGPTTATDIVDQLNANATLKARGITASINGGGKIELKTSGIAGTGASSIEVTVTGAAAAALTTTSGFAGGEVAVQDQLATETTLVSGETFTFRNSAGTSIQVQMTAGSNMSAAVSKLNQSLTAAGIKAEATFDATTHKITLENTEYGSASTVGTVFSSTFGGSGTGFQLAGAANTQYNIAGSGLANGSDGKDVSGTIGGYATTGVGQTLTGLSGTAIEGLQIKAATATDNTDAGSVVVTQSSMTFQIGAFAHQTIGLSIADVRADQLGNATTGTSSTTPQVSVGGIDVTRGNGKGAEDALMILDTALTQVNGLRAGLGSFQKDTLQSSIRNMMVATQNMRTSESQIRDANMAEETLSFSRSQILQQTGIAMLTQANQAPNQLMSLFRG